MPPIKQCPNCRRYCMDLALHAVLCAEEPEIKKGDARERAAEFSTNTAVKSGGARRHAEWEEAPATAPSLRELQESEFVPPAPPPQHVACPSCGRRFTADRIHVHRRACAGQGLPGYRAVVAALDSSDREEALVLSERAAGEARLSEERARTESQAARADAAEARANDAEAALRAALAKAERGEAAAKSMECGSWS